MKHTLKTLTLTIALLVGSVSVSYAEWTKVDTTVRGADLYVDLDGVRKSGGYVYFWQLMSYKKPQKNGEFSGKVYIEVNCQTFRFANLSYHFFDEPMGMGNYSVNTPKQKTFHYPHSGSPIERALKMVCNR